MRIGSGRQALGLTYLDKGEIKEVAAMLKFSVVTVSLVANGRRKNSRIMEELRKRNDRNARFYKPQES